MQRAGEPLRARHEPLRRLGAQRRRERRLGLAERRAARARRRQHERADALGEPERLEPARSSEPASSPLTIAVSTSPASRRSVSSAIAPAQQLERDDRDRLVEREAVELGEAALVLDGDEPRLQRRAALALPGLRRPLARTGSTSARPASSGALGAKLWRSPRARPLAPARSPARASAASSSSLAEARRTSSAPRASKARTVPPISVASAPAIASRPRSASTIRSSRSCAAIARRSTSYCSLTSRLKAASVTAMNGTS